MVNVSVEGAKNVRAMFRVDENGLINKKNNMK